MEPNEKECVTRFCRAVLDERFDAAREELAPWLQEALTVDELEALLRRARIDGAPPPGRISELGTNSTLSFESLREVDGAQGSITEYARGAELDPEVGMYGPPAFAFAPELTADNFRAWGGFDLAPAPDAETDLDSCARFSFALAEVDGRLCIGHLDPELT